MQWLWLLFMGLLVGVVARLLMPGSGPRGFLVTAVLGIAGMLLGGWIGGLFFGLPAGAVGTLQPAGFLGGVVGALILLGLHRLLRR